MTKKIGVYEAKNQLPHIIRQVNEGETFVITKHGKPVAKIIPYADNDLQATHQALEDLKELSDRLDIGEIDLAELIQKGRR